MSLESLRGPIIISLTFTAAVAAAFVFYQTYSIVEESHPQSLHRSNAVRRPRRQTADPNTSALHRRFLDDAIIAISEPAVSRGEAHFGTYQNDTLLPILQHDLGVPLDLDPRNLRSLYYALRRAQPSLTTNQQRSLRQHVQAMFVREFILTFFREGHRFSFADENELSSALNVFGISRAVTSLVLGGITSGRPAITNEWNPALLVEEPRHHELPRELAQTDGLIDDPMSLDEPMVDFDDDQHTDPGHNMLNLLYHIAREQAKQNGYVHRGVECNSCGALPIQGIRYHCANCFDFDLCETCEAKEVHMKNHVFYKIRIPAPSRGQIKTVVPKWYPGDPILFPSNLPEGWMDRLKTETGLDQPDILGLYEQFKCLAGQQHDSDPIGLKFAIDRAGFDSFFIPSYVNRPTPANLIYDRIFAFYDANDDGLIDFVEFIKGITKLNDKSFTTKLKRIFQGYDLDGDGYVCRKDFLRMFRAYYDLTTQLSREMLYRNEELNIDDNVRQVVQGNNPISAAFLGSDFPGHLSRNGQDKQLDANGDLTISEGPNGVLQDDLEMTGHRNRAVSMIPAEARERHPFRSFREERPQDEPLMDAAPTRGFELLSITNAQDADDEEILGPNPPFHTYGWPPVITPEPEDIVAALGANVPLDQIGDPVDRSRVIFAQSQRFDTEFENRRNNAQSRSVNDRWRRRQFYLDEEEGMTRPATYAEADSSEDESHGPEPETIDSSRGQSLRSRSSSKVRFDDSAIDTDYETRSNASSRSIPQNERWGGYELSRPTLDVGADVLYEAVQQGFNELIDCLFKDKEEEALEAQSTRKQRTLWETHLNEYSENRDQETEEIEDTLIKADSLRTQELLNGNGHETEQTFDLKITGEVADMPGMQEAISSMQSELTRVIKEVTQLSREPSPRPPVNNDDDPDPTLPQFRPNGSDGSSDEHQLSNQKSKSKSTHLARKDSPPSRRTLALWLKHRRVDTEAQNRGGHGRLNLIEFRKAIENLDQYDRNAGYGGRSRQKQESASADTKDQKDAQYWEKNPGLGRLEFLGTWLEMASF